MSSADAEHKSKLEEQAKGKAGVIMLHCHPDPCLSRISCLSSVTAYRRPCILLLQPCIHTQADLYELLPSARLE